jgi:hypothetical protein
MVRVQPIAVRRSYSISINAPFGGAALSRECVKSPLRVARTLLSLDEAIRYGKQPTRNACRRRDR